MNNKGPVIVFGVGTISLLAGAVSIYVDQHLSLVAGGLCVFGIVLLAVSLIGQARLSLKRLTFSRWKKAGLILLAIVLSVFFVVGVNYLAAALPLRWDVTKAKQHTLSASTVDFIKGLKQDVQFSALYVGLPPTYLEDLLNEYARISRGKIKTEIIDPIQQISTAAQFGNVINGQESKVVVRSGKERKDVDFSSSPLSEEQLTNALVRVTRQERRICFLTGHGEYPLTDTTDQGLTTLAKMLDDNHMSSRELMLGTEEKVPLDCDVLVVAGPHNDLTEKEESKIDQYLKQGGDALFLVENVLVTTPDKPLKEGELHKNPSLNKTLEPWGVRVSEDVVVDLASHAGADVGSPATRNYAAHKAITEGLDYTFYVRPRSITVLKDRRPSIKLAPIVMTAPGDKSWAETDRTLKVDFDPLLETQGPIPLAYVIMDEQKAKASLETRIIVFTDADFLTNIYIDQYSNAQMGLNVINWLSDSDERVFIDPKEIKIERLDLTSKQRRKVAAILFLMPVLIVVGGIMVWMKR